MEHATLLKNENSTNFGLDVKVAAPTAKDTSRPARESLVVEVHLKRNPRFASVGELELTIAVGLEIVTWTVSKKAETLVNST